MSDDRPNIVFINVDQMRYDCLSIAGHPVVETPHLDYLAHRGVRFTNAFTGVMSCIAARAAIHTGMNQRNHGRVGYRDGVAWNYPVTLAGELTKAGYQTQAVGKMHVHPQRWPAGFQSVILHDGMLHYYRKDRQDDYESWLRRQLGGQEVSYFDHGLASNSWVARPWHLPEHLHPTNWVVTRSVEFLARRDPSRPFFLFMSFVRPHAPLDPPQVYWDQYIDQELPAPAVGDWAEGFPMPEDRWNHNACRARLDPRALRRAQCAYYALITHLDHQIGRFLEHLGDHGARDNTVFVFAADHGELLGDHHLFRKALGYSGSAQVPFFVTLPEGLGGLRGAVAEQVVELRDIMPTLLDVAGAEIPECVDGMSLLPILRGQEVPWRQYVHGEHAFGELSNHYITDGRHKYIWYSQSGLEQLFDIAADRQELHDLADRPEHAETLRTLRSALAAELAGREEGYSDGSELKAGCTAVDCLSHILPAGGSS
ncbi:MAG: arylsulfatase [Planctomycetales bacterium 4484_123]|nr:MAG: arylsulfatase [Planctomycetales bacterium 4484_123]